jgi:uncharacterized protein YjcR
MNILSKAEHDKRLKLYKQGLTDEEIAVELGTAATTISKWRNLNGLPVHKKHKLKFQLRTQLYKAGYTDGTIAYKCGVTSSAIAKWRQYHGLRANYG